VAYAGWGVSEKKRRAAHERKHNTPHDLDRQRETHSAHARSTALRLASAVSAWAIHAPRPDLFHSIRSLVENLRAYATEPPPASAEPSGNLSDSRCRRYRVAPELTLARWPRFGPTILPTCSERNIGDAPENSRRSAVCPVSSWPSWAGCSQSAASACGVLSPFGMTSFRSVAPGRRSPELTAAPFCLGYQWLGCAKISAARAGFPCDGRGSTAGRCAPDAS